MSLKHPHNFGKSKYDIFQRTIYYCMAEILYKL